MPVMSRPSKTILPAVGETSHVSILKNVLFARAVGTDDAAQLTGIHGEIDVLVGGKATVVLGEPVHCRIGPLVGRIGVVTRRHRGRGGLARDLRPAQPSAALLRSLPPRARLPLAALAPVLRVLQAIVEVHDPADNAPHAGRTPGARRSRRAPASTPRLGAWTTGGNPAEEPDRRAHEGTEERATTANGGLHDELARGIEGERVGGMKACSTPSSPPAMPA